MGKVAFELPADDLKRVAAFYKEVFGWSTMQLPFDSAVIDTDGKSVDPDNSAGVFSKRNDFVKAPVLIISVSDIDAAIRKVKPAGGEMLTDKEKVGDFGYSAYAKDTEGTVICLWEQITITVSLLHGPDHETTRAEFKTADLLETTTTSIIKNMFHGSSCKMHICNGKI